MYMYLYIYLHCYIYSFVTLIAMVSVQKVVNSTPMLANVIFQCAVAWILKATDAINEHVHHHPTLKGGPLPPAVH